MIYCHVLPLLALKVLSEFVDVAKAVGVLQSAHAPVLRIFVTMFWFVAHGLEPNI